MIFINYLLINIIASIFGIKEAILFERQGAETFKWNLHKLFIIERSILCILIICLVFIDINQIIVLITSFIFSFSFFHNVFYNFTKLTIRKLNPSFKDSIFYVSKQSNAK